MACSPGAPLCAYVFFPASPRPYYSWSALSSIFILLPFDPFAHFPTPSPCLHSLQSAYVSAMPAEQAAYVEFLGPLLIGVTGNAIVFGICCMQLVTYIASKYDDSPKLRCVPFPFTSAHCSFCFRRGRLGGSCVLRFGHRNIGSQSNLGVVDRLLIAWVYAVDIFQVWQSTWTLWHYTVANFDNPAALAIGPWEYASLPIFGAL